MRSGVAAMKALCPHDPLVFRKYLGAYPTGVCVLSSWSGAGEPIGMTVGSFTSVSLTPPLVAFMPARSSRSWAKIERIGRFCVNILSDEQADLCRTFAGSEKYRFTNVSWRRSEAGLPLIDGVVAAINCSIDTVHEAGDHFIVVARVESFEQGSLEQPLLFSGGEFGHFVSADERNAEEARLRQA